MDGGRLDGNRAVSRRANIFSLAAEVLRGTASTLALSSSAKACAKSFSCHVRKTTWRPVTACLSSAVPHGCLSSFSYEVIHPLIKKADSTEQIVGPDFAEPSKDLVMQGCSARARKQRDIS